MQLLDRLKAAWLSFRDPDAYWEGVSIRGMAREITLKGGMAILQPDPQTEYVVKVLPYRDQRAIENYLNGV